MRSRIRRCSTKERREGVQGPGTHWWVICVWLYVVVCGVVSLGKMSLLWLGGDVMGWAGMVDNVVGL